MQRYSAIIDYKHFNNGIHSKMANVKLLASRSVPCVYRCFPKVFFTFNVAQILSCSDTSAHTNANTLWNVTLCETPFFNNKMSYMLVCLSTFSYRLTFLTSAGLCIRSQFCCIPMVGTDAFSVGSQRNRSFEELQCLSETFLLNLSKTIWGVHCLDESEDWLIQVHPSLRLVQPRLLFYNLSASFLV